jgi:hypothetical protein
MKQLQEIIEKDAEFITYVFEHRDSYYKTILKEKYELTDALIYELRQKWLVGYVKKFLPKRKVKRRITKKMMSLLEQSSISIDKINYSIAVVNGENIKEECHPVLKKLRSMGYTLQNKCIE